MVLVSLFHCENVKQESEEEEEEQGGDEQEGDDVIVEDDEAAKEDEEGDKKRDNEWGAEEEKIDMRERGDGQVSVTIIYIDLSVRKVYLTETTCHAGSEIALSWLPMRLQILHWRPEFHHWSPAGD